MPKDKLSWQVSAYALAAIIGCIQIARHTTLWFLAIPLSLTAYICLARPIRRTMQLRKLGFYRGHRIQRSEFEWDWVYEEIHDNELRELHLRMDHTDPGMWELFVPSEEKWRVMVPSWAQRRRDEIVSRVSPAIGSDRVHLISDVREQECKEAFESIFSDAIVMPKYEQLYAYGHPAFAVTFPTKSDLDNSIGTGYTKRFTEEIGEICQSRSDAKNPFDADRAIWYTYEGEFSAPHPLSN